MSALPILTILKNGETIRSQNVESDLVIGRGDGCVIRLDDRAVSRQHAILKPTADGVQIEKKSEFAPLSVNGAECTRALLKEGDIIEIGPYLMKLSMKMNEKAEKIPEQPIAKMAAQIVAFPKEELPKDAAPILEMPPREEEISQAILSEVDPNADPIPEPPTSEMFGESPLSPSGLEESSEPATSLLESPSSETVLTTEVGGDAEVGLLSLDGELAQASEPDTGQASPGLATPIDPSMGEEADKTSLMGQSESGGAPEEAFAMGGGIFDNIEANQPMELQSSDGPMEVDGTAAISTSAMQIAPQAGENDATRVQNRAVDAKIILTSGTANMKSFDLTSGEVSIGRGKNCNIVIDDKKSSRKNAVIVKEGNRWIIRDLDSANGTYVNGNQIKEHVLEADDVIQIGATELQFQATNPLYAKQKKNFLSVPNDPTSFASQPMASPLVPDMAGMQGLGAGAIPGGIPGIPQPVAPKKGIFGIYDRYIRNFSTLKPVQKILVILVLGFGAMTFLEEEEAPKKPQTAQTAKPAGTASKPGVLSFDSLSPQQKEFVTNQYQLAFEFYTKKDYNQAIYEIGKIYPILPDYEKAKELERYALEGKKKLQAIEEERQKKEEEARLKARIAEFVEKARGLMEKKKYEEARELFSEILAIEPDNADVATWQREIDAHFERVQREEQERLVQEEINKRAWDQYNEAFELQKAAKYHEAIEAYGKVADMGSSDKRLLGKAKTMIQTCVESIRDLRDPVIAKGKEFEESGDLGAAFKEYEKATKIDPPHPAGYAGMDRIRDVLNDRAKVLYTEAVIAESYSDFNSAYRKYKEILNMAPEGSLYHQRATRKLAGYFNFKPSDEATQ